VYEFYFKTEIVVADVGETSKDYLAVKVMSIASIILKTLKVN